ncbi:hypothetical protein QRD43_10735 [Pelomonas sp. APW6]|uniref:Uncharacterized protein n=1 Tax=Roseateles subflavus TaxID=3053353 RepID=A0ABT7LHN9_9BURK|nr:hypothetical protein [Pelomonas sp. APW6]MDL5032377.1 hypothetical protein [Pelomonas sp. APW6]
MTTQSLHTFSDSGLHTALLVALLLLAVAGIVDAVFFTPEGQTPVIWRLETVVVEGKSVPR